MHAMTLLFELVVSASGLQVNRVPPPTATVMHVDVSTPRAVNARDTIGERGAPAPWASDDPADSLYRAARQALADGDTGGRPRSSIRSVSPTPSRRTLAPRPTTRRLRCTGVARRLTSGMRWRCCSD